MPRPRLIAIVLGVCLAVALAALGIRGPSLAGGQDGGGASTVASDMASDEASDGASDEPSLATASDPPGAPRPNVVLILTDDLDKSVMPYLPNVNRLIRDQGARLPEFYVEQSSCCPSRASILTGLYAHNHGVIGNVWPQGGYDRWKETEQGHDLPVWLEEAGYRNAMLGKYMNEYPYPSGGGLSDAEKAELKAFVPPGWQSWASPVQGNAYAQNHYRLNVDGEVDADFREKYLDSVLAERALDLVKGADGPGFADGGQFLYYSSYSPHTPYAYPEELEGTFADARYPRTPDFGEADVSDKFGLTRTREPLSAGDIEVIDETFRKRIRSVQVLDQFVARLVEELKKEGALENTYLIFTSDNGLLMGNHRREIGKYNQFQGTVNVPFYIRGPGIPAGATYDDLSGNVDIAPTIAEIAGAQVPAGVDGVSLLSRLQGGEPLTRRYLLLGRALTPTNATTGHGLKEPAEAFVEGSRASRLNDFTGVTNGRYKLIRYTHIPHEELYDLNKDPYELDNLLRDDQASYLAMSPRGQEAVDTLRAALDRLLTCSGETCR